MSVGRNPKTWRLIKEMGWKDKEGLKLKLKKFRIAEGGLRIGGRNKELPRRHGEHPEGHREVEVEEISDCGRRIADWRTDNKNNNGDTENNQRVTEKFGVPGV